MAAALPHVDDFVAGHSLGRAASELACDVARLAAAEGCRRCVTCSTTDRLVAGGRDRRRWPPSSAPGAARRGQPGAAMVVGPTATAVGSVSGGCVEGAVYELAQEVVATGEPPLQRYGVSDDDAFAVGLTCGGIIDIFVEPISPASRSPSCGEVAESIEPARAGRGRHGGRRARRPARRAAGGLAGPRVRARSGSQRLDDAVADDARGHAGRGPHRAAALRPRRRAARRTSSPCSSSRSPRRPGCWSSAPSTSPPRWPGSARSSATG